jgi:hypothetical protein
VDDHVRRCEAHGFGNLIGIERVRDHGDRAELPSDCTRAPATNTFIADPLIEDQLHL